MTPVLKPSEIVDQLRYEFEQKLKGPGVTWNKDGVLHTFDRAVAAAALWYADMRHEERPTLETRDEQIG